MNAAVRWKSKIMSKLSEKNGVEVPIYEWLGKMGWQCRTNDDFEKLRQGVF